MPLSLEGILPGGADTLLVISGLKFLYSARGLTQTLDVISQTKQQARTINGQLIDVSNPAFRKYLSKITCTDVDAPPIDNLWPGMEVTVQCALELCYESGNPGSPARTAVSGSTYTKDGMTFYRPLLTMMVTNVTHTLDEWKRDNGWSIELEEV